MRPGFAAGTNMAMKVPPHEYERTISFYRDVLGFEEIDPGTPSATESTSFRFGSMTLWIDKVAGLSQSEIWLEVTTTDIEAAAAYFREQDCERRDEIEPLPDVIDGFWIASPTNVIHLVHAVEPGTGPGPG